MYIKEIILLVEGFFDIQNYERSEKCYHLTVTEIYIEFSMYKNNTIIVFIWYSAAPFVKQC